MTYSWLVTTSALMVWVGGVLIFVFFAINLWEGVINVTAKPCAVGDENSD